MKYCNRCGRKWHVYGVKGVLYPSNSFTDMQTQVVHDMCLCGNSWLGGITNNPDEHRKAST